jgi:hypothetical protein
VHSTADLVCWCLYRLHFSKDSRLLFSTDGLIAAIQVENMTPPPPPTDEKPLVLLAQPLFPEFAAALSPSYRLALAAEQTVAGETRPAFRHPARRARRSSLRQDARGVPASVKTRAAFRRPARCARRSDGLRDALGVPAPARCPRCSDGRLLAVEKRNEVRLVPGVKRVRFLLDLISSGTDLYPNGNKITVRSNGSVG